jgi:hypothetical protein
LLAIQSSTKISLKILPELILAQLDPRQNKIHNPEEICKTSIRCPKNKSTGKIKGDSRQQKRQLFSPIEDL